MLQYCKTVYTNFIVSYEMGIIILLDKPKNKNKPSL